LTRVGGRIVRPIAPLAESLASGASGHLVCALSTLRSVTELATLARDFVAPAVDALYRGDASVVKLIASGSGRVACWSAQRPSWVSRLRRKQAVFIVPRT
jgi:hypothetical protein